MTITFYTSIANPKDLDKSEKLSIIGTGKILTPTRGVSILNPVVTVDYNALFVPSNYAYISAPFSRYYFVKCAVDTAGKIVVECTADTLYSWQAYIKECSANIIRAEQAGVNYVVDKQLPIDENRYFTEGKKFSNNPFFDFNSTTPPLDPVLYGHQYVVITR